MKHIGLCMIVKNEAEIITKCLDAVKPLISYVLIEDTGSNDGTQDIIKMWLYENHMPGEVIEEPWQNFAYNRSHVMAKMREVETVDYQLTIDADDQLILDAGLDISNLIDNLDRDFYDVAIRYSGVQYSRPQLTSNRLPFQYKAVLHEYLETVPGASRGFLQGVTIVANAWSGARGQDPKKYEKDAALLEEALKTETDSHLVSRYQFYYAQSLKDSGQTDKSIEAYLTRASQGGWNEEVYVSLVSAARLMHFRKDKIEDIQPILENAIHLNPQRGEALYELLKILRLGSRHHEAIDLYENNQPAVKRSPGHLFSEDWVYDYAIEDEASISYYWIGEYRKSLTHCLNLLALPNLPADYRARVATNAFWALSKL